MVNLDEDFEEVSKTLPKGLLYSKETGLIIQSEVDGVEKALYITPEHLSKNEDSLFNDEGKINADFMSDGILPSGLSFEKGILKIGNGNQYGGLIVNNLMAITSLPIGEEDGTGKNMYLLENGQNYYQYNNNYVIPGDHQGSYQFIPIVKSKNLYKNEELGIFFSLPLEDGTIILTKILKDVTDDLNCCSFVDEEGNRYSVSQFGDGMNPICDENINVDIYKLPLKDINNQFIVRVKSYAFQHTKGVKYNPIQYSIPEKLGDVFFESNSFKNCTSLNEFFVSTSTISNSCFEGCTNLSTIRWNKPVDYVSIEDDAFNGCSSLNEIYYDVSDGTLTGHYRVYRHILLSKIGRRAFKNCSSLEELYFLYLHKSVVYYSTFTTICESAFEGCSSLKNCYYIPEEVTNIESHAFYNCTSLQSLNTSFSSLLSIGDYCFYNNYNLNIPNFPTTVTTIGQHAFHNCKNLKDITLNNIITSIGEYAFWGCDNLILHNLPKNDNYSVIKEGTFDSCNFELDEIPETIHEIESGAFNNGYGRISRIKCPNLILRNGSFTFMEFTEDIDATAVQNFTIEENAFKTALGKMKVNANVFQQLVSSGRARPKGQEEDIYYIDSEDFIIEKVEI